MGFVLFSPGNMKVITCEIVWHNKEPVYSLDFQHGADGRINRLASAGVDTAVRVSSAGAWRCAGCGDRYPEYRAGFIIKILGWFHYQNTRLVSLSKILGYWQIHAKGSGWFQEIV